LEEFSVRDLGFTCSGLLLSFERCSGLRSSGYEFATVGLIDFLTAGLTGGAELSQRRQRVAVRASACVRRSGPQRCAVKRSPSGLAGQDDVGALQTCRLSACSGQLQGSAFGDGEFALSVG
jgi:hypothetical protein